MAKAVASIMMIVILQQACRGVVTETNVAAGMVGPRQAASDVAPRCGQINVSVAGAGKGDGKCATDAVEAALIQKIGNLS